MSLTKHAIIRYQVLDRCLRNTGSRYNIEDLLEECNEALFEFDTKTNGIKKRQLYDDIRFMQSEQGWSIPLEKVKSGRTVYYQYEDRNFSINNQPLNQTEATHLKSAMMVLSRFKGLPQFEWIEELIPKLDQTFNISDSSEKIMSFDNNEFLKGIEHLSSLFNAITYKKVLNIAYHSFKSDKAIGMKFHPYHLKQYNRRWFLLGKTEGYSTITNLALDRIIKIEEIDLKYINNEINFDEYFEDVIGVTITDEKEVVKIEMYVTKETEPYIRTKPIHESQSPLRVFEDGFKFFIKVIPNSELESLVLGFGENLKVLEPKEFKEKILKRLKLNLENYN